MRFTSVRPSSPQGLPPAAIRRIVVSWSSGKDSAFALYQAQKDPAIEVVGLLTTVTETFGRVSIHGVREELLVAQAGALGLPLDRVAIPYPCPNAVYERAMSEACSRYARAGVDEVVFGDLFLEDVRAYREQRLQGTGLTPRFPLWGRDTRTLAREMIDAGFRATLVCIDPDRVPPAFVGREFDRALLDDLPPGVDPCGENGEFHTFVHNAPNFAAPIRVTRGETVERDGSRYVDLRPTGPAPGD